MNLAGLPEEFLASLPRDCWNKARCHLTRRHGLKATRNGWQERTKRLKALRTQLGKFYVTGAYKTPPRMNSCADVQHQDEVQSIFPV